MLADQEVESLGQNQKWLLASCLPVSSDPFPSTRLYFIEILQPPEVSAPAGDQVFQCIRLGGDWEETFPARTITVLNRNAHSEMFTAVPFIRATQLPASH